MSAEVLYYPLWRRALIADARSKLKTHEKALARLQDPSTSYARSIAAVVDLHRQALAVYEKSPEKLDPQGETQ